MGKDAFVNTSIYQKQSGSTTGTEETAGGIWEVNGITTGLQVTISPASGTSNVCNITFQVQDGAGNNVARPHELLVYLSDSATGNGLTATTASGGVAAGSKGTVLQAKVAAKAIDALTDNTGAFILAITDTSKTLFVPCVSTPGSGIIQVGAALVSGNYG